MNRGVPTLRARRRQDTHAEIVRAAFELFAAHGYEAVSTEEIAAAAGVSRATFFNYFPRKDWILLEVAKARSERLKALLKEFRASGRTASFAEVVELLLKLTEENAQITHHSKRLLLDTFVVHVTRGLLLPAREQAIKAITEIVKSIPGKQKTSARLIAETLFATYLSTMLEWLMREDAPRRWLMDAMRARLRLVLEGAA